MEKTANNKGRSFTVTAHTGCEGTKDNSLEAIKKGYDSGADIVEFDVHFNSVGEPVLAHDYAADDSVKLRDAFMLIAECDGLRVNVDCKTVDNLKAITKTAEECGVKDRIFYTGIEEKDVETVKRDTPEVTYYLNKKIKMLKKSNKKYIKSLVNDVRRLGAAGLNISYKTVSEKMVNIFHEEGLEVSVWTVNTESAMKKIVPLGCDNITTRQPSMLFATINK